MFCLRMPHGGNCCTRLSEVVCKSVDEAILEVYQDYPMVCLLQRHTWRLGNLWRQVMRISNSIETCRGFQLCFLLLRLWHTVEQQGRSCTNLCHTFLDPHCSERESSVQVPIKGNMTNGSSIPTALSLFALLNKLHCPCLWSPTNCHSPCVDQKGIYGIKLWSQVSLNMVYGVNELAVEFNLASSDDLDTAMLTNPGFVIPVNICAHGDLRLFLGI
mmetsp:Transcript_21852/g.47958  ORF Transcript_21852/g.47958 Transcript_21852/m.47958 type:complete len:216 (-) Transcript_21852:1243-1890(-)